MQLEENNNDWEKTVVAFEVDGKKYTIADARELFDSVQRPGNHWKDSFCAKCTEDRWWAIRNAIIHFHGSVPFINRVDPLTGLIYFHAPGYIG